MPRLAIKPLSEGRCVLGLVQGRQGLRLTILACHIIMHSLLLARVYYLNVLVQQICDILFLYQR